MIAAALINTLVFSNACGGTVEEQYGVEMRDGVRLSVWVKRPSQQGQFPAVLHKFYGNGRWKGGDTEGPINVKQTSEERSYIDIISRERPGGTRFISDIKDLEDIMKWLETKEWFNGKLGMKGCSYGGATQWLATRAKNPILKVITPGGISPDMGHNLYRHHGALMLAMTAKGRGVDDIGSYPDYTPLRKLPLIDMSSHPLWKDYTTHWTYDEYWKKMSYRVDGADGQIAAIKIPCYIIGGWWDNYASDQLEAFRLMREAGNDKAYIRINGKNHCNARGAGRAVDERNERDFQTRPDVDLPWLGEQVSPFNEDTFRMDILNGSSDGTNYGPPVTLFVMGLNEFRGFSSWPVPNTEYVNYYLHSPDGSKTGSSLSTELPTGDQPPDTYYYDPEDPVPTLGGNTTNETLLKGAGSFDQRPNESRDDVLAFTSEPLADHTAVVGRVKLRLWASSSAKDTDFIVKLIDVYPDGTRYNVCEGILRCRFRKSVYETPELMTPGAVYEMEVNLHSTANVFLKGHQIGLDITSSSFPQYDRNLNTGNDPHTDTNMVVAKQTIFHDLNRPTHLVLPVVKADVLNAVDPDKESSIRLNIYPNPATESAVLDFPESELSKASLFLYDSSGRLIREAKRLRTQNLDISGLAAGSYFVIIRSEEKQWRGTLIKE